MNHSGVQGTYPFYLDGMIIGHLVSVMVDTGSTHNDINFHLARRLGLRDHRINTRILVGSGEEVPCHSTSLHVPLRIDSNSFTIDAFLLVINRILTSCWEHHGCRPWAASLGISSAKRFSTVKKGVGTRSALLPVIQRH